VDILDVETGNGSGKLNWLYFTARVFAVHGCHVSGSFYRKDISQSFLIERLLTKKSVDRTPFDRKLILSKKFIFMKLLRFLVKNWPENILEMIITVYQR
jgi:hypothetical protein